MGEVLHIYEGVLVCEGSVECKELVQKLILLKEQGSSFAKKLLNSIYGRLAMKVESERAKFYLMAPGEAIQIGSETTLIWHNLVITTYTAKRALSQADGNISVAAIVAAKARIRLHSQVVRAMQYGKLLYIDTDCLFVQVRDNAGLETCGVA